MANPIAEAFVTVRPDVNAFASDLQKGVNQALRNSSLTVPVKVGQGFQQQVRTATTGAVAGAVGDKEGRTLAQKLFGPGFRNETGRALQGALSGVGQGQLAAQFAFFGPGGAALAVLGGALAAATIQAGQFERSLDVLQVTSGATKEELAALAEEAKALGRDITLPGVTAQTAADAMSELAKAGLSVQDALSGARGVLQLATAAETSAGNAAQIVAGALNAFSLEGTQAVHVADLLAGASISAQGDIGDMALALQQSAAVADQAGLSLDQLVGLITELARQGILGSDAGTSIRTMLLRLTPTTKEASQITNALGIELDRTRTIGEQLPEILNQYQRALARLDPITRQQALTQIFGTDAIRAATVAFEQGAAGLEKNTKAADRQGAAAQLAAARTKGFLGSIQGLTSGLQTLGITVGTVGLPALTGVARGLTDLVVGIDIGINKIFAIHKAWLTAFGDFVAPDFVIPTDDLDKLQSDLEEAQRSIDSFGESNAPPALTQNIRDLAAQLRIAQLSTRELQDLFAHGSGQIAVALRDGVISPLETIELLTTKVGRAFLAGFAAPGDDIRKQVKAVNELNGALGRMPTAQEVSIVLKADTFSDGLRQVVTAAFQAGTLAGDAVADAFETSSANRVATGGKWLVDGLASLTPVARHGGEEVGSAFADGFDEQSRRAIAAARQTLAQIREQGNEQILAAIREARGNLESLGDALAQDLGDILDASPIAASVRRQFDLVGRQKLTLNLDTAKRQLREAQQEIQKVGTLTPEGRRRQEQVLAPLRIAVATAQGELKKFNTREAIKTIDDLQKALDDLQDRVTRRQLRFDLTGAQQDLRDAQKSIQQVGVLTPAEKKAQQEFLAPFREKVKDAKASLQEFKLQGAIDEQEKLNTAAKKAAEEGVQELVQQFEDGKISADELNTSLRHQLGPAFDILKSKAGVNLGLVITRDFKRDVEVLLQQAKDLAGFLGRPGTQPGPQSIKPATTVSDVQAQIRDATVNLNQTIKDAKKSAEDDSDDTQALLRRIAKAVEGTPSKQSGPGSRGNR